MILSDLKTDTLSMQNMIESTKDSAHDSSDSILVPINLQFKEARERRHLSQKEFSQKIGISNVQLSRIEQSECRPSISTIRKAAPYIGSDLTTLLLCASYSGQINSEDSIYLDLEGNSFDLQETAKQMYAVDGELFILIKEFFSDYYQHENAETLKILLKVFTMNQKIKKSAVHFFLFSQLYQSLKSILSSINLFIDSILSRESI